VKDSWRYLLSKAARQSLFSAGRFYASQRFHPDTGGITLGDPPQHHQSHLRTAIEMLQDWPILPHLYIKGMGMTEEKSTELQAISEFLKLWAARFEDYANQFKPGKSDKEFKAVLK
jgi:hypothetical protein